MPRLPWREVDDELRFHLDMRVRDYLAQGHSPVEAERLARERLGDLLPVQRALRAHDVRRARMNRLWQDARIALRGFRRSPTFTVSAVVILGLGIGMAAAMWTVFNAVLIRPLPARAADRLVLLRSFDRAGTEISFSESDITEFRQSSRTMTDVAGIVHWETPNEDALFDRGQPVVLKQIFVTNNWFDVLGVKPVIGRLLGAQDDSTSHAMVLSYGAWQRRFGGDPSIIGRELRDPLENSVNTIVGVAPPGLEYPVGTELWRMHSPGPLNMMGRLAPGATSGAARTEFLAAARLFKNRHEAPGLLTNATVRSLRDGIGGHARPVVLLLTAAIALLLLIACVNVGNLLLLRASTRAREIAVRRSLGATYGDVVRQLVTENAVLALLGGVVGLAVGDVALRALLAVAPPQLPDLDTIQLSGAPIVAAAGLTLSATIVFGILPAFAAAGQPLMVSERSGGTSPRRRRIRQMLVASQVALALVMLAGAGLLVRSLARLQALDLGFTKDHVTLVYVPIPSGGPYDSLPGVIQLCDALSTHLQAIPGVKAVTPMMYPPFVGSGMWALTWVAEGQSPTATTGNPTIPLEVAGPDYFRVFGMPILRGRAFLDTDRMGTPRVAIVSETVARRLWPGQDPIGKRFRYTQDTSWQTVVGIVGDTHLRVMKTSTPMIYVPWRQYYWQGMLAIRATSGVVGLQPAIRRAVSDVDPRVTVWFERTFDDFLDVPLAQPRMSAALLTAFGLVALALAAIGLYGIMATAVREQTRDIGIRMALGATPAAVRAEILRGAMAVSLAGAAVGILGALAASRVIASLLFEVSPTDPIALAGACGVLLAVAGFAAYIPAYRASRIDPSRALHVAG